MAEKVILPAKVVPHNTPAYQALVNHYQWFKQQSLQKLFDADETRFEAFHLKDSDWLFDFSKNHLNEESLHLMAQFCEELELNQWREAYFAGGIINETEGRAVLHTALRAKASSEVFVAGENVIPKVQEAKKALKGLVESVLSGDWKGATGKTIDTVVNIGIGGSDLGPRMVVEALQVYQNKKVNTHFVSNVDGHELWHLLQKINAASSLFIIASKSFTTQETMTNAQTARNWLVKQLGEEAVGNHFIALSTNIPKAMEFGIEEKNVFGFWDWVGGRFSLWSAIGVSIAFATSWSCFEQLLEGAQKMDAHFKEKDWKENLPVLMAFIGYWYRNFHGTSSQAVIPYDQRLHRFSAYLQQGEMESNGKGVDRSGKTIDYPTCPVIWGEPGTNGQHAFFQLLHQGTDAIPVDFIGVVQAQHNLEGHHDKLLANLLAQSRALMKGKTVEAVEAEFIAKGVAKEDYEHILPHKVFLGNRPSSTFLLQSLNPQTLGQLIAAYEHKIFVQGIFWNVFSYDQWGVQLGKELAGEILPSLEKGAVNTNGDSSTKGLMQYIFDHQGRGAL